MSRVGKAPVSIPTGVDVALNGRDITVKGSKGTLEWVIPADIKAEVTENEGTKQVVFTPSKDTKRLSALWGTARAQMANMVKGVSEGYNIPLKLIGVGYRAQAQGNTLNLSVGYSHPVAMTAPQGITIAVNDQTEVVVSGADKQQVGQFAANIRRVRPPEPFKGKGIRYANEYINMKEGKKK